MDIVNKKEVVFNYSCKICEILKLRVKFLSQLYAHGSNATK